jgi:urocanate hydratase
MARERIRFRIARANLLAGPGQRHRAAAFNEMVAKGELKAPIVIGRTIRYGIGREPEPRPKR